MDAHRYIHKFIMIISVSSDKSICQRFSQLITFFIFLLRRNVNLKWRYRNTLVKEKRIFGKGKFMQTLQTKSKFIKEKRGMIKYHFVFFLNNSININVTEFLIILVY